MKDIFFLNQKSEPATIADKQVAEDLLDTLKAHEAGWVCENVPDTGKLKWSIRTAILRSSARSIPTGSPRSFSMSATICRESSSKERNMREKYKVTEICELICISFRSAGNEMSSG